MKTSLFWIILALVLAGTSYWMKKNPEGGVLSESKAQIEASENITPSDLSFDSVMKFSKSDLALLLSLIHI